MPYWLAVVLLRPAYRGGKPLIVFEWRALMYRLRKLRRRVDSSTEAK